MADTVVNGRRGEISLLGHIVTQKNSDIFSQMLNLFYAFKFSNTDWTLNLMEGHYVFFFLSIPTLCELKTKTQAKLSQKLPFSLPNNLLFTIMGGQKATSSKGWASRHNALERPSSSLGSTTPKTRGALPRPSLSNSRYLIYCWWLASATEEKQPEGKKLTLKWILTLYSTPSFNTKVSFLSASRSPARRGSSH